MPCCRGSVTCSDNTACQCPVIFNPPCPPPCPTSKIPKKDDSPRYYQQIGANMIDNELIISIEKEKGRTKKLEKWDPPCDCAMVEIQRPTSKEGPKIINPGLADNRILFRIASRSTVGGAKQENPAALSMMYKMREVKDKDPDMSNLITLYPTSDGYGEQLVQKDTLVDGDQNVFFLRVKRQGVAERKERNVELELRTPKPPSPVCSCTCPTPSVLRKPADSDPKSKTSSASTIEPIKKKKKGKKK